MRLYLVRHAPPQVAAGICYGSTDLTVAPEEQQCALAHLVPALPRRVPIFSSPLQRCHSLASALAIALDAGDVRSDARLAEMHFGAWEMQAWSAIPRGEIDSWAADPPGYRPGGGENVLEAAQRVRAFYDELHARSRESVIVVCHAGTIRLLSACRHCATPETMATHAAQTPHHIAYGEIVELDCQSNKV